MGVRGKRGPVACWAQIVVQLSARSERESAHLDEERPLGDLLSLLEGRDADVPERTVLAAAVGPSPVGRSSGGQSRQVQLQSSLAAHGDSLAWQQQREVQEVSEEVC